MMLRTALSWGVAYPPRSAGWGRLVGLSMAIWRYTEGGMCVDHMEWPSVPDDFVDTQSDDFVYTQSPWDAEVTDEVNVNARRAYKGVS